MTQLRHTSIQSDFLFFFFGSIEAAVATFAQARPPGIYKEDYLKELFRRYGDVDDAPAPPELPEWCFDEDEEDDDDNGKTGGPESEPGSSSSSFGKRRKERLKLVILIWNLIF